MTESPDICDQTGGSAAQLRRSLDCISLKSTLPEDMAGYIFVPAALIIYMGSVLANHGRKVHVTGGQSIRAS